MPHLTLLQSEVRQKPLRYHSPIHDRYTQVHDRGYSPIYKHTDNDGNKQVSTNSVITVEQHFLKGTSFFFDCVDYYSPAIQQPHHKYLYILVSHRGFFFFL